MNLSPQSNASTGPSPSWTPKGGVAAFFQASPALTGCCMTAQYPYGAPRATKWPTWSQVACCPHQSAVTSPHCGPQSVALILQHMHTSFQLATREPFSMLVPGNPARSWAGVLCALAVPPRTVKHTTTIARLCHTRRVTLLLHKSSPSYHPRAAAHYESLGSSPSLTNNPW